MKLFLCVILLAGCQTVFGTHEVGKRPVDAELVDSPDAPSACPVADNFDTNLLDTTHWRVNDFNSPVMVAAQNQRLEFVLPMDAPCYVANSVDSVQPVDLTNATVEATVYPMSEVGYGEMFLLLVDPNGTLEIQTGAGKMNIADSHTGFMKQLTWDPVNAVHWRYRYDGGTKVLSFEISPDGQAWTSLEAHVASYDLTTETIRFGAGAFSGMFARGNAAFDDFAYCHLR